MTRVDWPVFSSSISDSETIAAVICLIAIAPDKMWKTASVLAYTLDKSGKGASEESQLKESLCLPGDHHARLLIARDDVKESRNESLHMYLAQIRNIRQARNVCRKEEHNSSASLSNLSLRCGTSPSVLFTCIKPADRCFMAESLNETRSIFSAHSPVGSSASTLSITS